LSFFDRIFAGRVLKDYGTLQVRNLGLGRYRTSVLLAERRGKLKLVFKVSGFLFPLAAAVHYFEVPIDRTDVLRRVLDDVDEIVAAKIGPAKAADPDDDFV
jgi:hypothetical protein